MNVWCDFYDWTEISFHHGDTVLNYVLHVRITIVAFSLDGTFSKACSYF